MPIKYTRDGRGLDAGERENRWPQPRLRQRMLIIYAGLSVVALLLIGYFVAADPRGEHTPLEARATVLEKRAHAEPGAGGEFELVLEVRPSEEERVETSLFTDETSWAAVSEGDEVIVRYERPFLSRSVRVYRMRMAGGEE